MGWIRPWAGFLWHAGERLLTDISRYWAFLNADIPTCNEKYSVHYVDVQHNLCALK